MSSNGSSYRPGGGYGQRNPRQSNYNNYSNHGGNGRYNNFNQNQNQQQGGYNNAYQRKPYGGARAPGASRGNYNSYGSNQGHSSYENKNQSNQLWMGDLDPNWDEAAIKKIWSSFGDTPVSVKIIRDKTGELEKPLYCFVTFATKTAVATAVQKNGLQIPGSPRTFKLNWASGGAGSYSAPGQDKNQTEFSVFIGDLGPDITELQLYKKFGDLYPNQVKGVKIMMNPTTRASKGFGFVKFHSAAPQKKALTDTTPIVIAGRTIRVGPAGNNQTTHSQSPTPQIEASQYSSIAMPQAQPSLNAYTDPYNTTIEVDGLSSGRVSDGELASYFVSFGSIVYCKIVDNVGYVKFYTRDEAETAMTFMYGLTINGCRIVLTWGKSKFNDTKTIKHEPELETKYLKAQKAPVMYGNGSNLVFSSLESADSSLLMVVDNEPHTVSDLDDIHVASKTNRDKLLSSALF